MSSQLPGTAIGIPAVSEHRPEDEAGCDGGAAPTTPLRCLVPITPQWAPWGRGPHPSGSRAWGLLGRVPGLHGVWRTRDTGRTQYHCPEREATDSPNEGGAHGLPRPELHAVRELHPSWSGRGVPSLLVPGSPVPLLPSNGKSALREKFPPRKHRKVPEPAQAAGSRDWEPVPHAPRDVHGLALVVGSVLVWGPGSGLGSRFWTPGPVFCPESVCGIWHLRSDGHWLQFNASRSSGVGVWGRREL